MDIGFNTDTEAILTNAELNKKIKSTLHLWNPWPQSH